MSEDKPIEVQSVDVDFGRAREFRAVIDHSSFFRDYAIKILERIGEAIAQKYVAENYQKIVKKLSPDAIATLALAQAGAEVNKTLKEKIPDKVLEVVTRDTEVWQRGLLGGMKRIR